MKKLLAILLMFGIVETASAASIVKIPLNNALPDFEFKGGVLSTFDDGSGGTLGDQNTTLLFVGAFEALFPDLNVPIASFTLDNVLATGPATALGNLVLQNTSGGSFSLWDPANVLLLRGELDDGVITGSTGASTGSFFNTSFGNFTAGTLLPFLIPESAGISFALSNIMSGTTRGLVVTNGALSDFTADASGIIEGSPIPEPMTGVLLLGGIAAGALRRRKMTA